MEQALRIALVGCGAMGSIVARDVYPHVSAATLVCVVDADLGRSQELGDRLGVAAFGTLEQAIAETAPDAVDVRTPHAHHEEVAVAAAAAGRQVLVEKPLAADLAAAGRIVDAAAQAGVVLAVAENYPHLAAVRAARALIKEGRIGEMLALRTTRAFRLDGVWVRDGWRQSGSAQAGVLLDQGTHQASLLRQLGGPIDWVSATPGAGRPDDTVILTAGLAAGTTAQLLLTWTSPGTGPAVEAEVFGTAGRIEVVVDYDGDGGTCRLDGVAHGSENYYRTHHTIIDDWTAAIRSATTSQRQDPLVTGAEALADLRFVAAGQASLRHDGARIRLSQLE